MLSRLKNTAKTVWSYVAPTIISTARLITSSGSALFSLDKFLKLIKQASNPYTFGISILLIAANIIVNFGTRIPSIYFLFHPDPQASKQYEEAIPEPTTWAGKGLNSVIQFLGYVSGVFVSFNSYLGFLTLYGFFVDEDDPYIKYDEKDAWKMYLIQGAAVFFAVSNFISYLTFNLHEFRRNAQWFAANVEKGKLDINKKYALYTALFSVLGMICVPLLGFFSTIGSLEKVSKLIKIPGLYKFIIAAISSFTATINQLFAQIPNFYKMIKRWFEPEPENAETISNLEKALQIIVTIASIIDSSGTVLSNFTGAVNTGSELLNKISGVKIDLENNLDAGKLALMSAAILPATSTGVVSGLFAQRGMHKNFSNIRHRLNTKAKISASTPQERQSLLRRDTDLEKQAVPVEPAIQQKHSSNDKHLESTHSSDSEETYAPSGRYTNFSSEPTEPSNVVPIPTKKKEIILLDDKGLRSNINFDIKTADATKPIPSIVASLPNHQTYLAQSTSPTSTTSMKKVLLKEPIPPIPQFPGSIQTNNNNDTKEEEINNNLSNLVSRQIDTTNTTFKPRAKRLVPANKFYAQKANASEAYKKPSTSRFFHASSTTKERSELIETISSSFSYLN